MKNDAIWILWRNDSQFSADFCVAWFGSPYYDKAGGSIHNIYDDAMAYCLASV